MPDVLATGAGPLHLAPVFNIDHTNAMAYATAARSLLSSPAEQALSPARARPSSRFRPPEPEGQPVGHLLTQRD
jgi:hypothetical protein